MSEKANTTKKMLPRTEGDAPAVLADSGLKPANPSKAAVGTYHTGEPSRLSAGKRGRTRRSAGVDPAKRKASGRKAVGF